MEVVRIAAPPLMANAYLITGGRPCLVDCGGDGSFMVRALSRYLDPGKVEFVFLTHSHFDHAMAAPDLKRWLGCRVVMHEREYELLESGYSLFGYRFRLEPDVLVGDGDVFDLGEVELRVVHTPGHTPGSVCYYEPGGKRLFSGDTVFAHGMFGRTDLPGGDPLDLVKSLEKLSRLDVETLYPGHGEAVGGARAHILEALEAARALLDV